MNRHLQQTAAGLALLLAVSVACTHIPAIGDKCKMGDAFCLDGRTSLACRDGALSLFACPGPKGCAVDAQRAVTCDQSRNVAPGEACLPEYEGRGQCAKEPTSYLQCAMGAWVKLACPGGTTCQLDGGGLACK